MLPAINNESMIEDIIASYETRIRSLEAFLEATQQVFQGFQESLVDTRLERGKINGQLRDTLARNGSLRKKDFDRMMNTISSHLDQSEQAVKDLSQDYLTEQTRLVHQLHEGLTSFTDALLQGQSQKAKEGQTLIREILSRQDESKIEVTSRLKEIQQGQEQTSKMLKDLLTKGEALRIRDFKAMLGEFKRQRNKRIAGHEQRRREVQEMLNEFKARRTDAKRDRFAELQEA